MEFVQPIRDKKVLETMKKILRAGNLRDYCLFVLGINSGLRILPKLSFIYGPITLLLITAIQPMTKRKR